MRYRDIVDLHHYKAYYGLPSNYLELQLIMALKEIEGYAVTEEELYDFVEIASKVQDKYRYKGENLNRLIEIETYNWIISILNRMKWDAQMEYVSDCENPWQEFTLNELVLRGVITCDDRCDLLELVRREELFKQLMVAVTFQVDVCLVSCNIGLDDLEMKETLNLLLNESYASKSRFELDKTWVWHLSSILDTNFT